MGRFTTEAEVDFVVQHLINTVHRLREMRLVFTFLGRVKSLNSPQPIVGDGPRRH